MGPAPLGLGGVHRQIGVHYQLIEIGAVLRRQRDANAGVGREMMTEALAGLPDRFVDSRHEFYRVGDTADRSLDHGKFVAAQPGDEIGWLDAVLDAGGHGLQQLVADVMAERVVDALELVDIDVEQGKFFALNRLSKLALDLLAEQYAVRQVGQCVVVREVRDFFVGTPALGHVIDDIDDVTRRTCGIANPDTL